MIPHKGGSSLPEVAHGAANWPSEGPLLTLASVGGGRHVPARLAVGYPREGGRWRQRGERRSGGLAT